MKNADRIVTILIIAALAGAVLWKQYPTLSPGDQAAVRWIIIMILVGVLWLVYRARNRKIE